VYVLRFSFVLVYERHTTIIVLLSTIKRNITLVLIF